MRKKLFGFIYGRLGIFVCIAILFPLLAAVTSSSQYLYAGNSMATVKALVIGGGGGGGINTASNQWGAGGGGAGGYHKMMPLLLLHKRIQSLLVMEALVQRSVLMVTMEEVPLLVCF